MNWIDTLKSIFTNVGDASADTIKSIVGKIGDSPTNLIGWLSAINTKTAGLPATPADQAKVSKMQSILDLPWSVMSTKVVSSVAGDITLGVLTIAGLPAGATVVALEVFVKFSERDNTNAVINGVTGAQNLQIKKNAGGFNTFFAFAGGEYSTPSSTNGYAGDVIPTSVDIYALGATLAPVNGDTLTVQWTQAVVLFNNLVFDNLQVFVRIFYTV